MVAVDDLAPDISNHGDDLAGRRISGVPPNDVIDDFPHAIQNRWENRSFLNQIAMLSSQNVCHVTTAVWSWYVQIRSDWTIRNFIIA